jgi:hypothetical protein
VRVETDSNLAQVTGLVAFYHPAPATVKIAGKGAALIPEVPGAEANIREVVWTEFDHWEWNDLRLPSGIRMGTIDKAVRLPSLMQAEASFTEDGLAGTISGGGWKKIEDAQVAVSSQHRLALNVKADGQFRAGPDEVMAAGQYLGSELLDDEQRRRQQLLQRMFSRQLQVPFPAGPTLIFWADPLDLQIALPEDAVRSGSAMVYLPLTISATLPGKPFIVPASFLPFRTVSGPSGRGAASSYNPFRHEWVTMKAGSDTWLRVQLPEAVLPAEIRRLNVRLQMHAASRRLEVAVVRDGKAHIIYGRDNPSGTMSIDIEGADRLPLDESGGLLFGLIVSDAFSDARRDAEWQVQSLQLTAYGTKR